MSVFALGGFLWAEPTITETEGARRRALRHFSSRVELCDAVRVDDACFERAVGVAG